MPDGSAKRPAGGPKLAAALLSRDDAGEGASVCRSRLSGDEALAVSREIRDRLLATPAGAPEDAGALLLASSASCEKADDFIRGDRNLLNRIVAQRGSDPSPAGASHG